MRGFWKTGKELSDRAEISRISSWALGTLTCEFQPDRTTLKGGGVGWSKFSARFSPWRKSRRGMKFGRFLSWISGHEMHPSPSLCDHWNRRSLNIVVVNILFKEARVCLLEKKIIVSIFSVFSLKIHSFACFIYARKTFQQLFTTHFSWKIYAQILACNLA